jgi:hypothetical protein
MKFHLEFENTKDVISFDVVYNPDLIKWFIIQAEEQGSNRFFNNDDLSKNIDSRLNDINWALSKTNEIYWLLSD